MLLFHFIKKAQVNILSIVVITKHFCFLNYEAHDASETFVISGYFGALAIGWGGGRWESYAEQRGLTRFPGNSVLGPVSSAAEPYCQ